MAKILIIDDDESVRAFCRDTLTRRGHVVTEAIHARQGIEMYQKDPADLVLMDVFMPGMDGTEATEELKYEFPRVKVVAMSGGILGHSAVFLEEAQRHGAVATIAKPFSAEQLYAIVETALKK
jgi:DNA-binding NtrC family response regulator